MILLRRNKGVGYKAVIDFPDNDYFDDRIIKLDSKSRYRSNGIDENDIQINQFHHDILNEIKQASLVVYKSNWANPTEEIKVLKFRYPENLLPKYLDRLNNFPIFVLDDKNINYGKDN